MKQDVADRPIALVLGFSIHGLAIARALHADGIVVHAISDTESLATCKTSYAYVHVDQRINSNMAIDCINDLIAKLAPNSSVVLFPTNDKIVESLAEHWERIRNNVHLSWSEDRLRIRELMRKDGFAEFGEAHDLNVPRSVVLESQEHVEAIDTLRSPIVVKPAMPLGGFKVLRYETHKQAMGDVNRWRDDYPLIAQEWIAGDDTTLLFASYFVHEGKVLAEFTGRKLASLPPGLGQGVLVEKYDDENLSAEGRRIVEALSISGPVAIEFKRTSDGTLWAIEANVGRTEYSVDLLIGAGVNLPVIEFDALLGRTPNQVIRPREERVTWLDTDKEPLALFQYLLIEFRRRRWPAKMIFPYLGHSDPGPLISNARILAMRILKAVYRRLASAVRRLVS